MSSRQRRFLLVIIDYFTKWVEAKAFVQIMENEVQGFVWKYIICRHSLPYEIVTKNGLQFTSNDFRGLCDRWSFHLNTL